MSSIWNYLSTLRTGHNYLARSGNEMFGTVIQHGVNQKTVTVRTSFHHWNSKYLRYFYKHSKVQVHDENQDSVTGDKVIIKLCQQLSNTKSYYIKRIVKPFGRDDFYTQLRLQALADQSKTPQIQLVNQQANNNDSKISQDKVLTNNKQRSKNKSQQQQSKRQKSKNQKVKKNA